MPKISAHLGFTFRVGPLDRNQYGRVDLTVDQIDTELPIEPQIESSTKVADVVWEFLKDKVDTQIEAMLDKSA
jgi:hypothetical protein|tara:strand:- start:1328 stop:1546 length:219 start_codon:yes stop_codon:yes gene_type:complete